MSPCLGQGKGQGLEGDAGRGNSLGGGLVPAKWPLMATNDRRELGHRRQLGRMRHGTRQAAGGAQGDLIIPLSCLIGVNSWRGIKE